MPQTLLLVIYSKQDPNKTLGLHLVCMSLLILSSAIPFVSCQLSVEEARLSVLQGVSTLGFVRVLLCSVNLFPNPLYFFLKWKLEIKA